jgi:hypothetical protein
MRGAGIGAATTDPKTQAALTIMAHNLYDMTINRTAAMRLKLR